MQTRSRLSLWSLGTLLLSGAVLAAPPTTGVLKLAFPGFSYVNLEDKAGDFFLDYFTQQLQQQGGIVVVTRKDVAAILGLEREREFLNCAGENDCTAELTGALGVDGVISGSLAKTAGGYVINLKVIAARNAQPMAVYSTRVKNDEALLDYLNTAARLFVASIPRQPARTAQLSQVGPWHPALAVGIGLLAVGGGSYALARSSETGLRTPNQSIVVTPDDFRAIRARGEAQQTVAFVAGGLGLATLGASAALWMLRPTPRIAVAPLAGGGMVIVDLEASP